MFSNPGNSATIGNVAALAAAIGAAVPVPPSAAAIGAAVPVPPSANAIATAGLSTGSKLVTPASGTQVVGPIINGGSASPIDVSDGVAVSIYVSVQDTSGLNGAVQVTMNWSNTSGGQVTQTRTIEIPTIGGVGGVQITDRCFSSWLGLSTGPADGGSPGTRSVTFYVVTTNTPADRLRITDIRCPDGLLATNVTQALAAAGVSAITCAGVTTGTVNLRIRTTQAMTFQIGWGFLQPVAWLVANAANQDQILTYQAPNRPLSIKVTNGATAGTFAWSLWTNGE